MLRLTPPAPTSSPPRLVRRATALIARFDGSDVVVENYLTGRETILHPRLLPALGALTGAVSVDDACEALGGPAARPVLDQLVGQDVLLAVGGDVERRDRGVDAAWTWGHEARWFHYRTRRTQFTYDLQRERDDLLARAAEDPQPPPFKDYGEPSVALPPPAPPTADLDDVLRRRRTGRAFSDRALTVQDLATVLHRTWGISELRTDPGIGVIALKTSPSGGARHPVEVYCVAQDVDGLEPGVYHYCAGRHALSRLDSGTSDDLPARVLTAVTQQPWVRAAPAGFFMTGVTRRSAWKYAQSHAYRVLLLDAGHLGQTFHLVCTAMGLAPWTTAALDEEVVEGLLGLDDPGELVLYAGACGWPTSAAADPDPSPPPTG